MSRINWAAALVDVCIILLSLFVFIWRDNAWYLLLLLMMGGTGGYDFKKSDKRMEDAE